MSSPDVRRPCSAPEPNNIEAILAGLGSDRVVWAGLLALVMAIGIYAANMALYPLHVLLSDVDLTVYRDAGLAARRSPGQLYL